MWPALQYSAWQPTCDTLHMWTQMVGKTRVELTPLVNHWWNTTLRVSARGLYSPPISFGDVVFDMEFDFVRHRLVMRTNDGREEMIELAPRSVADFYVQYMSSLRSLGVAVKINTMPVEFADPIRFEEDTKHASYDKEYAHRFWRVLLNSARVFQEFRSRFIGKCSPVHFFWGSFDLAVTRFSGRRAPLRPEMDHVQQEAYSHEVTSVGFWPGDGRFPEAAFYAYSAPSPEGLGKEPVRPKAAFFDTALGEFLLKYDDVRAAESPDAALMDFCQSTYQVGAKLAKWDRKSLERS
jgi:uncharacterized protein DUF5996